MSQLPHSKIVSFVMTNNREKSKLFYQSNLGLEWESDDPFGSTFKLKDASFRITEVQNFSPSPHPILGWDVSDIAATIQDLQSRGVKMEVYEGFGQDSLGIWHSPDGKTKLAWFQDIDGNVLCLLEKK